MTNKEANTPPTAGAPPTRWTSAAPRDGTPTDRLAALFRAGETAEGLSGPERARIWSRLTTVPSAFQWRSLAGLRWVVAVAVLLTSGAVIGGVTAHRWWPAPEPTAAGGDERPATNKSRAPRRARSAPVVAPTAEPAPEPAEEPTPATPAPTVDDSHALPAAPAIIAAPVSVPPARPRAATGGGLALRRSVDLALVTPAPAAIRLGATPPPEPVPSTLSGETQVLGLAMTRLRRQGDPAGALEALDLYRQRFPHGTLQREADVARVDALLTLGNDAGALAVLRTLSLQPRGHDQELRVIRGELAAANSCPRAVVDFDAVLSEGAPATLAERALYGRAVCRTKQGDGSGANRDLKEYLRRFPHGQFAADARRTVGAN